MNDLSKVLSYHTYIMMRNSPRTRRGVVDESVRSSFTFLARNAQRFEVQKDTIQAVAFSDTGSKRRQRTSLYSTHRRHPSRSSQTQQTGACASGVSTDVHPFVLVGEINNSHDTRSHFDDSMGSSDSRGPWQRAKRHDDRTRGGEDSLPSRCKKYNIAF
jgi:hypothetical protein